MRTKKFFYNSVSTAINQVIIIASGFITPLVMLNYYGSEVNGLVTSVSQFIVYFNLVEVGLSGASIYALYKPLSEKNIKGINSIISASNKFYIKAGFIFLGLVISLAFLYPFFIATKVLDPVAICFLVIVLGLQGVLEFFTLAKYRVLLTADQRVYVVSLTSMVHIIINTTVIVVLGVFRINIILVRLVAIISIFIRSILLVWYTKKHYKFLNYKETPNYEALNRRWDAFYLQILGVIHRGAPVIILTIFTKDLVLISIYSIYYMVVHGITSLLSIFISGLSAGFGEVIARDEKKVLEKAYGEFELAYYLLITIIYSIAFIMIMPFIKLYTAGITDANHNIPILGMLFVINGLLYNLKTPQGMLVISAGLFKETKIQTTIQGLIAVLVGVFLVSHYGITGVILGSILSNIYRCIDLMYYVPRKVTNTSVAITFYRAIRVLFIVAVIIAPFYWIEIEIASFPLWFLVSIVISVYAILITIIINMIIEKEALIMIVKRLKGVLKL